MLGLFGTIARATPASMTRAASGAPSYGMIPPLGSLMSSTKMLISQSTAMGVSVVYGCVNRLATDLSRCKPGLYELAKDGSTRLPIFNHPLCALFDKPNRQQTWFEFSWMLWVGLLLRGNAYAAIRRDRRGNPIELIPINPDAVLVLEAADGSIFYQVNRIGLWMMAMLKDFPLAIPAEDVLHLRGLSFNALVGVSTIGLGRDAIGLAMAQEQQAARWIGNGARPSTWLKTVKTLSEAAAKRLKSQFDALHSGPENTGGTVVLEDGMEPVALQLTSSDLEFIQSRNLQVPEICRFFGVPPHKVGVNDRGSVVNIAAQDQDYVNTAVAQRCELGEQRMRFTFDLADEGIFVNLDESYLLRADVLTRRNAARIGILSGLTTPNEERKWERLAPMEGGDKLLVPANTAALGSDMTGTAPDAAGRPAGGQEPAPAVGTGGSQPAGEPVSQN